MKKLNLIPLITSFVFLIALSAIAEAHLVCPAIDFDNIYSSIPPTDGIDILDGYMVVRNDQYDYIYDLVKYGYNGCGGTGDWNGLGITSSVAALQPEKYTVGILTGAEYIANNGPTFHELNVADSWNLMQYTLIGDLNFDGQVDDNDFLQFVFSGYTPGESVPSDSWSQGDFNFDGFVDVFDLMLMLNNGTPSFDIPTEGIVTPEPSAALLLLTAIAGVVGFAKIRKK